VSKVSDRYRAPCCAQSGCRQCGKVVGPRSAYCSNDCTLAFERQHFWPQARGWAMSLWFESGATCARCGREPERDERYYGRSGGYRRFWWKLTGFDPEVNHKHPLNGQRGTFSCAHHQSNLEVVCHACHVQITVEQRAAGLIGKPKAQISLPIGV
jgi:hypothetical protein